MNKINFFLFLHFIFFGHFSFSQTDTLVNENKRALLIKTQLSPFIVTPLLKPSSVYRHYGVFTIETEMHYKKRISFNFNLGFLPKVKNGYIWADLFYIYPPFENGSAFVFEFGTRRSFSKKEKNHNTLQGFYAGLYFRTVLASYHIQDISVSYIFLSPYFQLGFQKQIWKRLYLDIPFQIGQIFNNSPRFPNNAQFFSINILFGFRL